MQIDLIISGIGQLVTCASPGRPKRGSEMKKAGIINDAALAIHNGQIVAFGKSFEILAEYCADRVMDARGKVVCPGFIDPHTHIVYAGDRLDEFELRISGTDYLTILAEGGGIISTVKKTRAASFEDLVSAAIPRLNRMLRSGTTAVEIKTGYGLDTPTELKMLAVIEELDKQHPIDIIPTFLAAHAIPPEFRGNVDGYTELICNEMLQQAWSWFSASHFAMTGKPFFVDVFIEKNAFDLKNATKILKTAKKIGFALKAHVDEFTNLGGSEAALALGAISIDHLDETSDEEVETLVSSETIGIVTPTVNFNFGSRRFADARKMIDAGCAIAISTDFNPGSAPCPSQAMAMAIACRYQKMLPAEAFNAATINAAYSIGMGDITGSLEPGKRADLLILDVFDYREIIYEFGSNRVEKMLINGEEILDQPTVSATNIDPGPAANDYSRTLSPDS